MLDVPLGEGKEAELAEALLKTFKTNTSTPALWISGDQADVTACSWPPAIHLPAASPAAPRHRQEDRLPDERARHSVNRAHGQSAGETAVCYVQGRRRSLHIVWAWLTASRPQPTSPSCGCPTSSDRKALPYSPSRRAWCWTAKPTGHKVGRSSIDWTKLTRARQRPRSSGASHSEELARPRRHCQLRRRRTADAGRHRPLWAG